MDEKTELNNETSSYFGGSNSNASASTDDKVAVEQAKIFAPMDLLSDLWPEEDAAFSAPGQQAIEDLFESEPKTTAASVATNDILDAPAPAADSLVEPEYRSVSDFEQEFKNYTPSDAATGNGVQDKFVTQAFGESASAEKDQASQVTAAFDAVDEFDDDEMDAVPEIPAPVIPVDFVPVVNDFKPVVKRVAPVPEATFEPAPVVAQVTPESKPEPVAVVPEPIVAQVEPEPDVVEPGAVATEVATAPAFEPTFEAAPAPTPEPAPVIAEAVPAATPAVLDTAIPSASSALQAAPEPVVVPDTTPDVTQTFAQAEAAIDTPTTVADVSFSEPVVANVSPVPIAIDEVAIAEAKEIEERRLAAAQAQFDAQEPPVVEEEPIEQGISVITKEATVLGDIITKGHIDIVGRVKGNIDAKGDVAIHGIVRGDVGGSKIGLYDCRVKGNLDAGLGVIVDEGSIIGGDVKTKNIIFDGKVKGNIDAENVVVLRSHSYCLGDVAAASLAVEPGAVLNGKVRTFVEGDLEAPFEEVL